MFIKERIYQLTIVILFIVGLSFYALYRHQTNALQSKINLLALSDSTYASQTKIWKDKYGQEHIQNIQLLLTAGDLQTQIKRQATVLKIDTKQITGETTGEFYLAADEAVHVDTVYVDSSKKVKSLEFSYKDKWIGIHGCLGQCKDSVHVEGIDTLNETTYWKRKWLLGDKIQYTDIYNSNPYIHMTGIKSLALANKEPKILIAPVVSIGYGTSNLTDHSPIPNLQIGIAIVPYSFSFKIR